MAVKFIFLNFRLPDVKISEHIFIYENNFFMFCNVTLFSVKPSFFISFVASFLLIKLIVAIIRAFNVENSNIAKVDRHR